MKITNYGFSKVVNDDFETALDKVKQALQAQGFGVLTTIDAQAKMKEKLGVAMERYIILGACHPTSAYKALQAEKEIGLLLPCNVIVYESEGKVNVAAIRPTQAMAMVENPGLADLADDVELKLKEVISTL